MRMVHLGSANRESGENNSDICDIMAKPQAFSPTNSTAHHRPAGYTGVDDRIRQLVADMLDSDANGIGLYRRSTRVHDG